MLLGVTVFYLQIFINMTAIDFTATTIGLLASPIIFVKSFENNIVEKFAPQIIQQKASGAQREWLLHLRQRSAKPLIGHGLRST